MGKGNGPGNTRRGAQQIAAVPAFVSTLCICIVFLPMFFLSGVAKFLFVPLAEAVSFAMLASYGWSRTIVPTMAMYLLSSEDEYKPEEHVGERQGFFRRYQQKFEHGFEKFREGYRQRAGTSSPGLAEIVWRLFLAILRPLGRPGRASRQGFLPKG